MSMPDTTDRLIFAVPKKGRLYEKCLNLLNNIGVQFYRKPRHDIALVSNLPVALVFLPAADIAKYVAEGNVDLGITGIDILKESESENHATQLLSLGFGKCKLQVQTPISGGADTADALVGKRIVTSFPRLAEAHFRELERRTGKPEGSTRIQFVSGSVEAACGLGLADGIVDLVESGETMQAAGLRAVDTILSTESVLIANKKTRYPELVEKLRARIEGVITAQSYVLCQYNIHRNSLLKAKTITPGRLAPSVTMLEKPDWVGVSVMVVKSEVADKMDELKAMGATDILILDISNCRV
ncbi:ATP phosphoribosyltransferase (ATP-PRTase) (ATP-PRT) [Spiromyces aspiralis]|uniref:ATP phosphoribosyltransferase (ATP-PRTase) (ATP-PRT) n=1 Tax=Spiromyces aspiralis TaxID=68401 RepID=A0ACC1HUE7_9FUNG|nr:ATP phosphoribosyltransferase (ATP-PRTase) (ATP-PRT) [Spiromyces aspiralis]